jgi:hypothetical protein
VTAVVIVNLCEYVSPDPAGASTTCCAVISKDVAAVETVVNLSTAQPLDDIDVTAAPPFRWSIRISPLMMRLRNALGFSCKSIFAAVSLASAVHAGSADSNASMSLANVPGELPRDGGTSTVVMVM